MITEKTYSTQGNNTVSSDFKRVLDALKQNIMRETNVSEIMRVESVSNDEILCTMLYNTHKIVRCTHLQGQTYQKNDIVLVIFTDSDFRQNLKRIKDGYDEIERDVTKEIKHTLSCGVILGLIYRKLDEGEQQ